MILPPRNCRQTLAFLPSTEHSLGSVGGSISLVTGVRLPYIYKDVGNTWNMTEYPRFLNHFIEAFWKRLKPQNGNRQKKIDCSLFTNFSFVSTNIDVFHVFSRSFVGCCRVCVWYDSVAGLPIFEKETRLSNLWRLKVESPKQRKFTSLLQKQVAKIETSFTFCQISLRSADMKHFVIMLLAVRWHWKSNHRTELDGKKCSEDIQKTSGSQNSWGRHQHVLGAFNQTEKY